MTLYSFLFSFATNVGNALIVRFDCADTSHHLLGFKHFVSSAVILSIAMLCQCVDFGNGSKYVIADLYMYCCWGSIYQEVEASGIIIRLKLDTVYLFQSRICTSNIICCGIFQCSACYGDMWLFVLWYWWNCWPSLFTSSFHTDWFILVRSYCILYNAPAVLHNYWHSWPNNSRSHMNIKSHDVSSGSWNINEV